MKYLAQIQNGFLFLLALFSIFRYGKRTAFPKQSPQKVLVVQLSKIGDMVCITPLLHALRKNLPHAKIFVLGDAINSEVLAGNTDFDEYIVFKRENLFSIVQRLRDERIEYACIRGIGFIGLVIALLAGIRTVVTGRVIPQMNYATRTYRWLLPFVHTVTFTQGEYMPRQFLKLLEPLYIYVDDTQKHLRFSAEGEKRARKSLLDFGITEGKDFIVGITASAGNKVKEWRADRFAEVADYLTEKHHARIILFGGPGDAKKTEEVLAHMKYREQVLNLQGCSVDETKAMIPKLDLFISADTGPVYIAEAFGVPTIDITGPIDEKEQPPISEKHIVVVPLERKAPELFVMNARGYNFKEARRQADSITVSMVIHAFEELYPRIKKST